MLKPKNPDPQIHNVHTPISNLLALNCPPIPTRHNVTDGNRDMFEMPNNEAAIRVLAEEKRHIRAELVV